MNKKAQKQIVRAIVMAQACSDAAKHRNAQIYLKSFGRCPKDYDFKAQMIVRALKLIDSNPPMGIHYWLSKERDQNRYPSILVYFDIKVEDTRYQISFHTPLRKAGELKKWVGKGRPTHWRKANEDGRLNCHDAAIELARIFDL